MSGQDESLDRLADDDGGKESFKVVRTRCSGQTAFKNQLIDFLNKWQFFFGTENASPSDVVEIRLLKLESRLRPE